MKIIFSRKGFDTANGFLQSPIFEDKTYFSLPIPYDEGIPFADVHYKCNGDKSMNLMDLLNQLGNFKPVTGEKRPVINSDLCHFDPDIADNVTIEGRDEPWQRGFGQLNGAQTHLEGDGKVKREKVEIGDLFIFFGRFQNVIENAGKYEYDTKKSDQRHIIFGWLQIDEIVPINPKENRKSKYPLLKNHPHYNWDAHKKNVIYLPTEKLTINPKLDGCGTFKKYDEKFSLSKDNKNMGVWKLPNCFHKENKLQLSYHDDDKCWGKQEDSGFFNLETADIGQEFVLNCNNATEATKAEIHKWLENLFA